MDSRIDPPEGKSFASNRSKTILSILFRMTSLSGNLDRCLDDIGTSIMSVSEEGGATVLSLFECAET